MDGGKQIEDALIAVQETDRYYGECNTRFHLKPLTPENDTRTGSKLRKIDVNVESPYQEAWSSLGNIVDVVSLQGVYRKHEILLAVLQKQIFTIEWMKEKIGESNHENVFLAEVNDKLNICFKSVVSYTIHEKMTCRQISKRS